jgi:hypothetical protein
MEHLKRMEDLTRRYASTRIGAAGLGSLWAFILATALIALIANYISAEFVARGHAYPGLWRFLDSDTLITPFWIKASSISVSILAWAGITGLQLLVDRRHGVAMHNDPTARAMRFLVPILFILFMLCAVGYNLGQSLAISDNNCECTLLPTDKYYGKSLFEIMDISSYLGWAIITAWGAIWAFSTRDTLSRTLAYLLTLMLFPIMSSTLNDTDIVMATVSLAGLLVLAILGLRQFAAFLKVRNEINALPVSE